MIDYQPSNSKTSFIYFMSKLSLKNMSCKLMLIYP